MQQSGLQFEPKSMIVVGVDPGEHCGVAVVKGRRLLKAHVVKGDDLRVILGLVQQIKKVGEEQGGVVVVIEIQHAARGKAFNPKTLGVLMKRRHLWEILCELYEIKVVPVWPSSWQSQLKIAARVGPRGGKRSTKDRSMETARFYFGDEAIDDHNKADASLIARWYVNRPEAA